MAKILKFKCKECGKEIASLYEKQLNFLVWQHETKHIKDKEVLKDGQNNV